MDILIIDGQGGNLGRMLTRRLREALPQADIVAVGSDLKIDEGAWTCGKEQSCPVSCGIPTVLVSRLTVGGVEG